MTVDRTPPADLRICADRPDALPEDEIATVPARLRIALVAFARAFALNAARLDRLVNWTDPAACAATPQEPR